MVKQIDISGQRFGRLLAVKRSDQKSNSGALWECVCDCGNTSIANTLKLRNGHTRSCGCMRAERIINLVHGLANKSPTYKSWKEMRNRCNNPNAQNYKWYGGRGITIDPRWDDYTTFLSEMGERPEGRTLDRINSDGNYEKKNCRWATPKEQAETNRGCFKKGQNRAA